MSNRRINRIADDYKKYYDDYDRVPQLAKYYLKDWDSIDKNIQTLEGRKLEIAKILYQTLGHLTEYERKLLADKYRVDLFQVYCRTDKELAAEMELTLKDYGNLRRGIEFKFFYYLKEYIPKILQNHGYYD